MVHSGQRAAHTSCPRRMQRARRCGVRCWRKLPAATLSARNEDLVSAVPSEAKPCGLRTLSRSSATWCGFPRWHKANAELYAGARGRRKLCADAGSHQVVHARS